MNDPHHRDPSSSARVFGQSVEQGYTLLPPVLLMTALVPIPLAVLLRDGKPWWMLAAWVAAHWTISGLRYLLSRRYWACPDRLTNPAPWLTRFHVGTGLSGFTWCALGTVLYPAADHWMQGVVGFVMAGISSIGLLSTGPLEKAYRYFVVAFLVPVALFKLTLGTSAETALGILAFAFAIMLMMVSRRAAGNALGMLTARAESEGLTEQLAAAIRDTQAKNVQLESEIQQRARAQEQERAADARLHLALESAGMFSWEYDLATREVVVATTGGRDNGPALPGGGRFSGFSELAHPDDRDALRTAAARAQQPGDLFRSDFRIRVGEQWRWISVRGRVVRADDGTLRMIGVSQDVTRRRDAQDELLKAKEHAEAASHAKSQFLANMSHEIRTPLNGVVGMLELLTASSLQPQQAHLVQTARRSADALLAVINNILDISKIESNRLELESIAFGPAELVEDVTSLLSDHARRKGITLTARIDDAVPPGVRGDPNRVRQVLLNLMSNALKFTEHGTVEVTLTAVDDAAAGHAHLRFAVRDTGIGLTTDEIGRLFQPFSQADMSTSRRFGGTGLGLAISQQLVELMGGSVAVTSEPGAGSTFTVDLVLPTAELSERRPGTRVASAGSLPVLAGSRTGDDSLVRSPTDASTTSRPDAPSSMHPATRTRVLVVEDHEVNRLVASKMLTALGCSVALADGGDAGVEAAQREQFDVILMDCQMPVVDGFEATRRIRLAEAGGRRAPIIALTANALQGDRERCLAAGMDDYLTKPYSRRELDQVLERWRAPADGRDAAPAGIADATADATVEAVLDLAALGEVRAIDPDGSLLDGIIRQYGPDGARLLTSARAAHAAGNLDALIFAVHTFKSSSGCVGARDVVAHCARIEERARTRGVSTDADELAALGQAFQAACAALEAQRAVHAAGAA
jgi:signal transduction histidine kinase/FixJ family two-component response regulator/HPt (histidine-containing phosphotransfer) domain-containing protein